MSGDPTTGTPAPDPRFLLLDTLPVGFYSLDRDFRFTYVNSLGEELLGRSRADVVGAVLWDLFPASLGHPVFATYEAVMASGEPATVEGYYPAPLDAWYEVLVQPDGDGLAVLFLDVTERKTVQGRAELLAQVDQALTGTLDAEEAAARLAGLVVPALADWCLVTLVGDAHHTNWRRNLRDVGSWHVDPDRRDLVRRYGQLRIPALTESSFVARALRSEQPVSVEHGATREILGFLSTGEAADLITDLAPAAFAVLPLRGRGRVTGLLSLFTDADRGAFADGHLITAADVAARAGLALDNARLYQEQRGLAEGLQRSLLTPPPEPDHSHVVVRYQPAAQAAQVGGDWYDAFLQPGGATVLVIGDVIGHDTQAAAAMGQIRTIVRTLGAQDGSGPADILRSADRVMETLMVNTAATVAVARFEQEPDEVDRGVTRIRWSNAGHPPPFVIDPAGGVRALTGGRADLLLGVNPGAVRREHEVELDRGSTVVLYTDGLVERRDTNLDHGLQRLQDTLEEVAHLPLDDLCDELLARMVPGNSDDDVAIVAVRLHRQDRPRPADAGPAVVPANVPDDPTAR